MENTEIMISIGEMAQRFNTTIQTIRWYEKELDLKLPRNELGQRIFGKAEIELFEKIFFLKEQGLNLKAIKKILENDSVIEQSPQTDVAVKDNSREIALYNNFIDYMETFRSQLLDEIRHESYQSRISIIDTINEVKEEIAATSQSFERVDKFIEEWRQKQKISPKKSFLSRIFRK
ncbi:helix-turn-helix domain-containing protein [Caldanaerobius polysaccharolyticus]|uniref:helix-turn-helix domain-containing protein n=1 Tax=Caldanaerobius polysaccharolyticus TaxID=44256 RepID=UPI00047BF108|nr:helix-turn-helix domain-containing protein [Caldanaerobius polysaccharolyticus]